jgi:predicted O-methyltransferase YrrM
MTQSVWTAVDRYLADLLAPPDPALEAALENSAMACLPAINVTEIQGKLLYLLALTNRARYILEIGTLGGYSTIWLARALPAGGKLITLESEPAYAAVAGANIAAADLSETVEIRTGPALETLPRLAAEKRRPFDLVFTDADKPSAPDYFDWALKLTRPGSLIIVDNVVRGGALVNAASADPSVKGVRRLIEMIAAESRVTATVVPTADSKGYDGMAIALVVEA